jgi:hypothetical protein
LKVGNHAARSRAPRAFDLRARFQPTGKDPEGKAVTFAILNKPSWAACSKTTGRLSGTPVAANVGTPVMQIATGAVTLKPRRLQNQLRAERELADTIRALSNPGISSYVVENISPGTRYFAVKAYTASGTESPFSNVVSKTLQ